MKAAFTLIPSESRRLIAKAVVQMEEIKIAKQKAYIILNGGTTNGYVGQELDGMGDLACEKFTAGTNTHRLLCVTDADKRANPQLPNAGRIAQPHKQPVCRRDETAQKPE